MRNQPNATLDERAGLGGPDVSDLATEFGFSICEIRAGADANHVFGLSVLDVAALRDGGSFYDESVVWSDIVPDPEVVREGNLVIARSRQPVGGTNHPLRTVNAIFTQDSLFAIGT